MGISEPVRAFTRPSIVRAWVRDADIRPNRLLGQNFLIDGNILRFLLDTAAVTASDRILEIGPGLGAVTAGLLDRGATVVAIEKDARFLPLLEKHFGHDPRASLIQGDALAVVPDLLHHEKITKVVANLPYTPGTRILVDIATSAMRPARIAVMVQDEVAGRITAEPGSTAFGLLSLWCRVFYEVSYVKRVSPNCFWPRPSIQSAIVSLERLTQPLLPVDGWPYFKRLTKQLFQHRRKQIGHLLHTLCATKGVEFPIHELLGQEYLSLRPEALPLDVWCSLSENMRMHVAEITSEDNNHGG